MQKKIVVKSGTRQINLGRVGCLIAAFVREKKERKSKKQPDKALLPAIPGVMNV